MIPMIPIYHNDPNVHGGEDLDDTKLQREDRERLEGKLADAYKWLENDGLKAR